MSKGRYIPKIYVFGSTDDGSSGFGVDKINVEPIYLKPQVVRTAETGIVLSLGNRLGATVKGETGNAYIKRLTHYDDITPRISFLEKLFGNFSSLRILEINKDKSILAREVQSKEEVLIPERRLYHKSDIYDATVGGIVRGVIMRTHEILRSVDRRDWTIAFPYVPLPQ